MSPDLWQALWRRGGQSFPGRGPVGSGELGIEEEGRARGDAAWEDRGPGPRARAASQQVQGTQIVVR